MSRHWKNYELLMGWIWIHLVLCETNYSQSNAGNSSNLSIIQIIKWFIRFMVCYHLILKEKKKNFRPCSFFNEFKFRQGWMPINKIVHNIPIFSPINIYGIRLLTNRLTNRKRKFFGNFRARKLLIANRLRSRFVLPTVLNWHVSLISKWPFFTCKIF